MLRSHVMTGENQTTPSLPRRKESCLSLYICNKVNPPLGGTGKGGKRKGPLAPADWRGCPRAGGGWHVGLGGGGEMRELDTP